MNSKRRIDYSQNIRQEDFKGARWTVSRYTGICRQGEVSLFKYKKCKAFLPIGLHSYCTGSAFCVFQSDAGPILIRANILDQSWLNNIQYPPTWHAPNLTCFGYDTCILWNDHPPSSYKCIAHLGDIWCQGQARRTLIINDDLHWQVYKDSSPGLNQNYPTPLPGRTQSDGTRCQKSIRRGQVR